MENRTYSYHGSSKAKGPLLDRENVSLDDILKYEFSFNQNEILIAFCNEIRALLELGHFAEMAEGVLLLEEKCERLRAHIDFEDKENLPSLSHFYFKLSPLLLRSLVREGDFIEQDDIEKSWLESLRISLEEEFYFWKEKSAESEVLY